MENMFQTQMLEMEKAVQQLATAERVLEIRIGLLGCALLYVYVKDRMDRGWSDRVTDRNILWKGVIVTVVP